MAGNAESTEQRHPRTLSRVRNDGSENRAPNLLSDGQATPLGANQSMMSGRMHDTTLDLPVTVVNQRNHLVTGSTKDLSLNQRPLSQATGSMSPRQRRTGIPSIPSAQIQHSHVNSSQYAQFYHSASASNGFLPSAPM